jgi:hypothetical protein
VVILYDMKTCMGCGVEKDEICFGKSARGKNGLRSRCKICVKSEMAAYYVANKKRINEHNKLYWIDNIEAIKQYKKKYYKDNKETYKKYCRDNKDSIQKSANKQRKERMKNDPSFRLRTYVSRSVRVALKGLKNSSTWKNLSYSPIELKEHLEKQFEPWMTWNNHGVYDPKSWDDNNPYTWTWQIDHIVPHSSFHYNSMESRAFKDCWALSNLRPYSAKQNLIEGVSRTRHPK